MNVLFPSLVLTFLIVTGSTLSHNHHHDHRQVILKEGHRFIIEFEEERNGNTKVLISQNQDSGIGGDGGFTETTKNMVSWTAHEVASKIHRFEQQAKEVIENAVGEVGESVSRNAVGKITDMFRFSDSTKGTLKDSMDKMRNWDFVDSPKRIGEDIERNATEEVEQGVEEGKETVGNVQETSLYDHLLQRSRKLMHEVLLITSLLKIRGVMSWCYLLGFSTAYGMGMWVTFFSRCVLGKCLTKKQYEMVVNKMNMVYFRAMAYCVGAAVFGCVMSQGRKGVVLSSKMEMFQGFNLVYALVMILINLIFLESQATKLIMERKMEKGIRSGDHTTDGRTTSEVAEKLKKLKAYSSTLNVSTMVVLSWHLAYISRLIQVGY